ncbi:hypothetical protein DP1597 [Desulfotalea psychrophila LSv54]|uniref:Uncharacterized protein n=2 Tax=Desulfotalea psychrophila TaxID=84980 RepID=Q6AMU8_DESPS|nr:hypothetical protein DP1597 [Desulfotalea psychrophila LSv54]
MKDGGIAPAMSLLWSCISVVMRVCGNMATNLWEQFKGILPDTPRIYCTIDQPLTGGRCRVTTTGGGSMVVLGAGQAGAKVWVQDGRIIGEAPMLQHYDIEV